KMLFTAYSQKELHILGRIVANPKDRPYQKVIEEYQIHLSKTFAYPLSRGAYENILIKSAGYFMNKMSKKEKTFFLETVTKFKSGKLPLSVSLNLLKLLIIRFDEKYLMQQTFLEPYPEALIEQYNSDIDKKE
ncbi:MAG: YbgA family protein, partial [Crenarchaeota archaeon]|nr:YbgA family protein [Thermoproteota archaeon]